jgi:probable rRNA maturation factor
MVNIHSDAYLSVAVPMSSREIIRICQEIFSRLGSKEPFLDVLITHDGPMKDLNRRFLGMEGPTNVLSFPEAGRDSLESLGQLVINIDAIKRESCLYGQDPADYLVRLLVHGILHLAGYEHGREMDDMAEELISVLP